MFIICRSPKGGVGTSVVAAAIALHAARSGVETLLVDLAGDQPDLLGVAAGDHGVADWLGGADVPLDGLAALEVDVAPFLRLLPRGEAPTAERLDVLAGVCASGRRTVVVDAGVATDSHWAGGRAEEVVVLRACYLAVRRAGALASSTRLVVIEEPGRALRAADVAAAVGVPVWRRLTLDPAVARSVDAGLLGARLPRSLRGLDLAARAPLARSSIESKPTSSTIPTPTRPPYSGRSPRCCPTTTGPRSCGWSGRGASDSARSTNCSTIPW